MDVEHIGPPHYHILSLSEAFSLHSFSNNQSERDVELGSNERRVIPVDVHRAIVDKLQSDENVYATSKSTSQTLLNTSVFQAQIFQLVSIAQNPLTNWTIALIVFICLSLCLQFVIFVLLTLLAKSKTEQVTKDCTATAINNLVTSLTGVLLIVTISISAITKISNTTNTNSTSV